MKYFFWFEYVNEILHINVYVYKKKSFIKVFSN